MTARSHTRLRRKRKQRQREYFRQAERRRAARNATPARRQENF